MDIINTDLIIECTDFKTSVINSLPSLNGLWFPKNIQKLSSKFFDNIHNLNFTEISCS